MKRTLIVAAISLAALSTGCTTTGGNAKPEPTSGTPTSKTSSALASIKPCDLLTEAEVKGLGLEYPGEAQKLGTSDGCNWKISGDGGLRAGIRTDAGVKDLETGGDKVSDIKVGKFEAVKTEGHEGAKNICAIWISVTESSSVSVISNLDLTSTDTAAACKRAATAAENIATKLS